MLQFQYLGKVACTECGAPVTVQATSVTSADRVQDNAHYRQGISSPRVPVDTLIVIRQQMTFTVAVPAYSQDRMLQHQVELAGRRELQI